MSSRIKTRLNLLLIPDVLDVGLETKMPVQVSLNPELPKEAAGKTVIVTGGANGIGAATVSRYNNHGANVVIADLPACRPSAEALIKSLAHPERALFVPVDILNWVQMKDLFKAAIQQFGRIDIVVANAAIMETSPVLDLDALDSEGDLLESREAYKVIDVNIKGTLNSKCPEIHVLHKDLRLLTEV